MNSGIIRVIRGRIGVKGLSVVKGVHPSCPWSELWFILPAREHFGKAAGKVEGPRCAPQRPLHRLDDVGITGNGVDLQISGEWSGNVLA